VIHPSFIENKFTPLYEACKAEKKLTVVFLCGDNISTKDFCSLAIAGEQLSKF